MDIEDQLKFLYFLLKSSPLASVIATMQKSTGTNNKTFFISDDFKLNFTLSIPHTSFPHTFCKYKNLYPPPNNKSNDYS